MGGIPPHEGTVECRGDATRRPEPCGQPDARCRSAGPVSWSLLRPDEDAQGSGEVQKPEKDRIKTRQPAQNLPGEKQHTISPRAMGFCHQFTESFQEPGRAGPTAPSRLPDHVTAEEGELLVFLPCPHFSHPFIPAGRVRGNPVFNKILTSSCTRAGRDNVHSGVQLMRVPGDYCTPFMC
jgi:hypothetical protein